jgi:hypothetical protein
MLILITKIKWDTEGMDAVIDCNLPTTILVVNLPENVEGEEYDELLSNRISDVYGFCHYGYTAEVLYPDTLSKRTAVKIDAVMEAPTNE